MTYFDSFVFKNGRTFLIDEDGNELDFCEEVKVVERLENIDDNTIFLRIGIVLDSYNPRSIIIPREELSGKVYSTLVANGLSVSKVREYQVTLIEILFETEKLAPYGFCHTKLGYKKIANELIYFCEDALDSKISSTYIGKVKFAKLGSFESWQNGLIDIINEHQEQLLVLAMGASAPIVAILEMYGVITETVLFALIGLTSKGKTTSISTCGSAWSCSGTKGIIDTIGGSENYLFASLGNKIGFPHFIDETTVKNKDFTSMIFKLSLGREGGKCLPDGTPRDERMWSTTVIFTGETSMLHSTINGGLHARLIEFDLNWTGTPEVADLLLEHTSQNFGTAYPLLINEIGRFSHKGLIAFYKHCHLELTNRLKPENGIEIRIVKKLAVLLMSIYICSSAWGFRVRKREMYKLLKQSYFHNIPNVDKIDKCYEKLKNYIITNNSLFPKESSGGFASNLVSNSSCHGVISMRNYKCCCWMLNSIFENILTQNGIDASRNVLQEMNRRGYIEHFSDRFRKNHNINGIDVLCVCIFLNTQHNLPPQKRQSKSRLQTKVNLLSEDNDEQ